MIFLCRKITVAFMVFELLLCSSSASKLLQSMQVATERLRETSEIAEADTHIDWSGELPASSLYSRACALSDGYSGRILYGKDETVPRANASTTKILTCILALENGNLKDTVTASQRAARQPKVHLGMKSGGTYLLKDLLYCLMLESYNDCAVAIAEHIAGSVEEFAALMNEKAKELGCTDTYFITPNGLDDENENGSHHTTAVDLCRLMRYCAWESPKSRQFLKITQNPSYSFTDGQGVSHTVNNFNRLLSTMDGALTGKTGFTSAAGYCYVMAYEKDGKRFCAAFLGCGWPNNRNYKWADAAKLIAFGESYYEQKNIFQMPQLLPLSVPEGCPVHPSLSDWGREITVVPVLEDTSEEIRYMVSQKDRVTGEVMYENPVPPVEEGDIIGCYEIRVNGAVVLQYPLTADRTVSRWGLGHLLAAVWKEYCLNGS